MNSSNLTKYDAISTVGPKVVVLAYDRLSTFEFAIAVEVFGLRRPEFGVDWYRFNTCSVDGPTLHATGGVTLVVDQGIDALDTADIIVIPGWRTPYASIPNNLKMALWRAYERAARIVGICGGAFVLAAAGLLSGRRATTHWQFVDKFIRQYPDIRMETAPLFCADDNLYTSAGSAAGIDLCLHIVQEDYGQDIANNVARRLVVPPVRPGGQTQTANRPFLPQDKHTRLAGVIEMLKADIALRYTLEDAAEKANLSPRTFLRHFKSVTGMNYGQWMAVQKVARAKTLLAETELPIEMISEACGYTSSGSLRRLFKETESVSPSTYRRLAQQ